MVTDGKPSKQHSSIDFTCKYEFRTPDHWRYGENT